MLHKFRINKNTHSNEPRRTFAVRKSFAYDYRSLRKRLVITKRNLSQNS